MGWQLYTGPSSESQLWVLGSNCAHPPAGSLASMDPSPRSLQQAEQRKELSCGEGQKRLKSEEEEETKG